MRILVVDDSEDWRDLTEAALMAAGYDEISTAESATAAYSALGLTGRPNGGASFDLVVLDVMMPEIDGIEACARIRSDARYGDMPVIMVTAVDDMDALSNAFIAGATDYITKPFNRVELLARVRSALKIKNELDRRKARESELISLSRSTWGDRASSRFVDEASGLFAGPAAEAYLAATAGLARDGELSVLALSIDRLDAFTAARGPQAGRTALAQVAQAVGTVGAPIGVVAAIYPDGVILLVGPQLPAVAARALGEALRATIAALPISNPEGIASDRLTISIGAVSSLQPRTELIAEARQLAKTAASAGGNRVAARNLSSN